MTPSALILHAIGIGLVVSAFWPSACPTPRFDASLPPGSTATFSPGKDAPASKLECIPEQKAPGKTSMRANPMRANPHPFDAVLPLPKFGDSESVVVLDSGNSLVLVFFGTIVMVARRDFLQKA